jgi:hypothetical protein
MASGQRKLKQAMGTVTALLVVVVALPAIARLIQAALPVLALVLLLLFITHLLWPTRRR